MRASRAFWTSRSLAVSSADVRVRLGESSWPGTARLVTDPEEDGLARRLLASKYQGWSEGHALSTWARTALPVAVDLRQVHRNDPVVDR